MGSGNRFKRNQQRDMVYERSTAVIKADKRITQVRVLVEWVGNTVLQGCKLRNHHIKSKHRQQGMAFETFVGFGGCTHGF
jgi:hypothetical protein